MGTFWAHEVDIFRTWKLIDVKDFHRVQAAHWKKLPYWIFAPVALAFIGSTVLLWYHPAGSPAWAVWGAFGCQALSLVLTVIFWGQWQAQLAKDPLGPRSPYLDRILNTHWVRTALITASALILFAWTLCVL
jgi:hypothetical protein